MESREYSAGSGDMASKQSDSPSSEATSDSPAQSAAETENSSAPPTSPTANQNTSLTSSPALNRKMIYKADVRMEVESYTASRAGLTKLVTQYQGYILSSSEYESKDEKGASIVIRIPQKGFDPFINKLDDLAVKIPHRSIEGTDVTEEYVDLGSRLKAKQAVETRLLEFMSKAQKTEDLLKISGDLATVQEEIERIKGRMRYLDENVAYSTITLDVVEKKRTASLDDLANQGTLTQAWHAFNSSLIGIFEFIQLLLVFIAAAIPVLILIAIPGVPIYLWKRKKRKNTPPTPPTPPPSID